MSEESSSAVLRESEPPVAAPKYTGDWRNGANCLSTDPELFFPNGNSGPAKEQIDQAKKVCEGCDVQEQCLQYALETGQDSGVWGGLSEDDRRALKRRAHRNKRTGRAATEWL